MNDKVAAALERLEGLLSAKEAELDEVNETIRTLEDGIESLKDGWQRHQQSEDDGKLPVPRLELVYIQVDRWFDFKVVYRLVTKHLLGHLVLIPLGQTRCQGGSGQVPDSLPFRDGAHALHDSGLLGLPAYKIMPDTPPYELSLESHSSAYAQGTAHRRPRS